jgi:hypothetical protein
MSVCFVIKRVMWESQHCLPSLLLLCKKLDNTLYDIVRCYVMYNDVNIKNN